jgi:hypothetical protein
MVNSNITKSHNSGSASRPNTFMGTLQGHVIVTDYHQTLVLPGEREGLDPRYHIRERTRSERGTVTSQMLRGRSLSLVIFVVFSSFRIMFCVT